MKKSEIYLKAQLAVLNNSNYNALDKLEIIQELMEEEKIAKFRERTEEETEETK